MVVDTARMTEQVLERALQVYLTSQRNNQPKIHHGQQTLRQLAQQNAGLTNIEISEENIKCFTHVAKKYHVDFALKKVPDPEHPKYMVFFKSRDADSMTAAFQEFVNREMKQPSIRERLAQARELCQQLNLQHDRVRSMERGLER